ncbi:hypothetical protein MMEU_5401 [Mycobacterium marinum str. Europe]|nr:hypothetical protein MMEU_5401 [Mycobacterium marinum str. Europe]
MLGAAPPTSRLRVATSVSAHRWYTSRLSRLVSVNLALRRRRSVTHRVSAALLAARSTAASRRMITKCGAITHTVAVQVHDPGERAKRKNVC